MNVGLGFFFLTSGEKFLGNEKGIKHLKELSLL